MYNRHEDGAYLYEEPINRGMEIFGDIFKALFLGSDSDITGERSHKRLLNYFGDSEGSRPGDDWYGRPGYRDSIFKR
jgi:hypothetical protein